MCGKDGQEMSDQATESFQDPGEDVDTSEAELDQVKLWALEKYLTGFMYLYWTSNVTNAQSGSCRSALLHYHLRNRHVLTFFNQFIK